MFSFRNIAFLFFSLLSVNLFAQSGILKGKVVDKVTKEELPGVNVTVVGTYSGTVTDMVGKYEIKNIKPGEYSVRISYIGYSDKQINAVRISANEETVLNIDLSEAVTTLGEVEIVGEKNIIELESGKSEVKITSQDIKEMNFRDVKQIAAQQVGVVQSPDGLQIRGGRVYETQYVVDGVSAQDPLSGTGFGVDVASSAVQDITVTTGGGDAEYGSGTSGVIATRLKEGGEKYHGDVSWLRDNLGFAKNQGMSWNTDIVNASFSGPVPKMRKKLFFFVGGSMALTDDYFRLYANQLHSTLFRNDSMWAPRQDNKWSNTVKISGNITKKIRFSLSNQHSLAINQNTRTLQIIGADQIMVPGLQFPFSLNLDNATTYTNHNNLTALNVKWFMNDKWTSTHTVGRLFVNSRADANGRPFRTETVDRLYDPQSIVTDPVSVFNPTDSVVYVLPGPGLINNNGLATTWHDHFVDELSLKSKFNYSYSKTHFITLGHEIKRQHFQWVDISKPWVGAPIRIQNPDGSFSTIQSTSIGQTSDVWEAKPIEGGFFAQDEIKYKGIIAFIGFRYNYWAPGKIVDNAVNDPRAPITDQIRKDYLDQTFDVLGLRFKHRLLPKLRVSFPVTENNVLYFNYGHSMRLSHPRFIYAGLDPVYQDRSFLSNLGNPNLNPETTVSYEVGLKTQITSTFAITATAFYNDKFDYVVTRTLIVQDRTGRLTERSFAINQDYARIRGLELSLNKRFSKSFRMQFSGAYQVASGKSNTAAESLLQIKQQGFISASKEQYLAWDRPFDFKFLTIYTPDTNARLLGTIKLHKFRFFLTSTYQSGLRYTPVIETGVESNGRVRYESDFSKPNTMRGTAWFFTDIKITRDVKLFRTFEASLSFEIKNLFNNKNGQIINPVTGRAYENGDPVLFNLRDPNYPDPRDRGLPSDNPARYLQPRQMFIGISFQF
jgi:outer membrane receptor protein involved in Fe transport